MRYLCLVAALLSPTPAPLLALNEPETSLHSDLLAPLARLCAETALQSQLWLTTHSDTLANHLAELISVVPIKLDKVDGETVRAGRDKRQYFSAEDQT
ncbi:MAG: AAA family ATPase [Fimbriimonadales bacterium]